MVVIPMLVVIAMVLGYLGWKICRFYVGYYFGDIFDKGLREGFVPYNVFFAMAKAYTFAFIISSIPAYFGYHVKGGALEIGRSSTKAVVVSCIFNSCLPIIFYRSIAIIIIMIHDRSKKFKKRL